MPADDESRVGDEVGFERYYEQQRAASTIVPDAYSLILIDNEVPGKAKFACIVNKHKSAIVFLNDKYRMRDMSTSESAFGYNSTGDVCKFVSVLHTLASGAGPKSDAGPKSVSGLSCRLIRFPEESDDMLLNVRLLYHNKMNLISQFTAWVHLVKWVDDTSRDRELAAWDVSMTSDQILKLFPPSSGRVL